MRIGGVTRVAVAAIACASLACGDASDGSASAAGDSALGAVRKTASDAPPTVRRDGERPLPAFSGRTLDQKNFSVSSLIGQRMVLFFFNPEVEEAELVAPAVAAVAKESARNNFNVVGIAMGSDARTIRAFTDRFDLDFPVVNDKRAAIANKFGLRQPVLLLGADGEGYLTWSLGYFNAELPDPIAAIERQIREHLRLDAAPAADADFLKPPEAPLFRAAYLDRDDTFRLIEKRGQGVVLVFFLHTCPHCHKALAFLKEQLERLPEGQRAEVIGVSLVDRPREVRRGLESEDLDYFEVLRDPEREVQGLYGVFGGVPVLNFIDAEGRLLHQISGWDEERDPALARMYLAKVGGAPVPMLLSRKGFTGNDVCGVCHSLEYATWQFTEHASAWDTLVTHGADRDPECVGCHSVGFGEPGGFTIEDHPSHLENVGCESCHGRGGPHLPGGEKVTDYEGEVCGTCHNPTHSLGFEYASFHPRISHTRIATLSVPDRQALIAARGQPRDVLASSAEYVGSDACQSCHAAEFATWQASPHAAAMTSLEQKQKAGDGDCQLCHTTAYDRPGGFPKEGTPADHPDLARVGCESCHGPGGDHVAEDSRKLGSIVSLGDKCDSCVILQICGSCHDHANDPDFEFSVQEHIDRQRHGTIEAGTGAPKGAQAAAPLHASPEWKATLAQLPREP